MALHHHYNYSALVPKTQLRINTTRSSSDQKGTRPEYEPSPAEQFAPLPSSFPRRLLLGVGSASVVAIGANFTGITSFLLGLSPQTGRRLRLDVLYPIRGYTRFIDPNQGFEFIYPAQWVADQTVFYRAAERAEQDRALDPPPLNSNNRRKKIVSEPFIAFGPPGSTGELNVSVIVSAVPLDFRIEAFGGAKEVGELLMKTITGSGRRADVKAMLVRTSLRGDSLTNVKYYELEFKVDSPSFQRHNVAVCCTRNGRLYTLTAQAPESEWQRVDEDFHKISASFTLTS